MSTFIDRVDPELLPGLAYSQDFPPPTTIEELLAFRELTCAPAPKTVTTTTPAAVATYTASGVPLLIHAAAPGPAPAILWIHGGGMIAGEAAADTDYCWNLSQATGATVIAVDYRLAPEHPYPAALEDVLEALDLLFTSADSLLIDLNRIAIAGSSAGAGLAAAASRVDRDRHGPRLVFQYLMYPMLDDSHSTPSSLEFHNIPTWNRHHSLFAWQSYLAHFPASPLAAPARATRLQGLPPTLIQVGELDLFRDEDIDYAQRLLAAGVPVELHVYPGAYHGYELTVPEARVSRQTLQDRDRAFNRALSTRASGGPPSTPAASDAVSDAASDAASVMPTPSIGTAPP